MKKFFKVVLILLMVSFVFAACNKTNDSELLDGLTYDTELLKNGNFENDLTNWKEVKGTEGYISTSIVDSNVESEDYDPAFGAKKLEIENLWSPTYYNLYTEIDLVKGVTYRLGLQVNIPDTLSGVDGKSFIGAFVNFQGDSVVARIEVSSKTNGFEYYEIYFTPKKSGTQRITIGLGTSDMLVKGKAYYDNISLMAVKEAPEGTQVYTLGTGTVSNYQTNEGIAFVTTLTVFSALLLLGVFLLIKFNNKKADNELGVKLIKNEKARNLLLSPYLLIIVAVVLGFVMRLVLVNFINGFSNEINSFSNWASSIVNKGITNFYTNYKSAAIGGGQLYIITLIGYLAKLFNVSFGTSGFFILLKIPSILCDLIMVYLIYELAINNKYFNKLSAFMLSLTYALVPVFFTVSSVWGQFTSVAVLFLALAIIGLIKAKPKDNGKLPIMSTPAGVLSMLALAIFFEPIIAVLLPIFIGYYTIRLIKNYNLSTLLQVVIVPIVAFVLYFVVTLPFTIKGIQGDSSIFMFVEKMALQIKAGSYYTVNTFNFFGMIGNNIESVTNLSRTFNILFALVIVALGVYTYYRNSNRLDLLLCSAGVLIFVNIFGLYNQPYFIIIALAAMLIYVAMTGEKRVFFVFSAYSVIGFVNMAQLMNQSGYIGSGSRARYLAFVNGTPMLVIFSIFSVLLALYFCYVIIDICYYKRRKLMDSQSEIASLFKDYSKGKKNSVKRVK